MNSKGLSDLEIKELFEIGGGETNFKESIYGVVVDVVHEIKEHFAWLFEQSNIQKGQNPWNIIVSDNMT